MGAWREQAHRLRREIYTLSLACRDPRVPWYVKTMAAGLVAYALSPIDLIPDFIPVLGYLDDLVVIPLGVLLMRRTIGPARRAWRPSPSAGSAPRSSWACGCCWPASSPG
jgi:uncharacterized membrane protein YkvA (DUF1232 family)